MKVAVTGGTGFIGNHLIAHLLMEGHDVLVTGINEEKAKKYEWYSKVRFVTLNINSTISEEKLQEIAGCQKLIHLAWSGLPNYKELFHFELNLMPQYNFLKTLVDMGMEDITVAGTCLEYGLQNGCLTVDSPVDPQNSYAIAKDTLRRFLVQLQTKNNFNLKWVRLFYMFGKGQSDKSILSQLDRALDNGDEAFNMSGGEQLRDYLPVEKVAENISKLCIQQYKTGIYNCSSGIATSVRTLVEAHLKRRNKTIKLNLGFYPYPDFEAMAFWGESNI
jgi:dTDP-6-deoxy-L-talose 4-dehydrogenase (NAD+)